MRRNYSPWLAPLLLLVLCANIALAAHVHVDISESECVSCLLPSAAPPPNEGTITFEKAGAEPLSQSQLIWHLAPPRLLPPARAPPPFLLV